MSSEEWIDLEDMSQFSRSYGVRSDQSSTLSPQKKALHLHNLEFGLMSTGNLYRVIFHFAPPTFLEDGPPSRYKIPFLSLMVCRLY